MEDCENIAYCNYCKEEVYSCSSYVVVGEKIYHRECYDLMKEELEEVE